MARLQELQEQCACAEAELAALEGQGGGQAGLGLEQRSSRSSA